MLREVAVGLISVFVVVIFMMVCVPIYQAIMVPATPAIQTVDSTGGTSVLILGLWPLAVAVVIIVLMFRTVVKPPYPEYGRY